MSIFSSTLFGSPVLSGLGSLPEGARPLTEGYRELRLDHPSLPKAIDLPAGTHYTVTTLTNAVKVDFYRENGRLFRNVVAPHKDAPAAADVTKSGSTADLVAAAFPVRDAFVEPQGGEEGAPSWLPYALVGGGVLVAGTILMVALRPAAVQKNRRRSARGRGVKQ
jgi:hypothetical protein